MNKIGIISLLPDEIRFYQQELRQRIAAEFGLDGIANPPVPAHITIKYPFPIENLQEIEKTVQEFCTAQRKTTWLLQGFNYFQNAENPVIFIDVIPTKAIRKAHASFLESLRKISWVQWARFDNANLHYHVTLAAHGITFENFQSIWSFVNQHAQPRFEAVFDNLSLVQINEDSRSVYKTFWFQSQKAG